MSYEVNCPWEGWLVQRRLGKVFGAELYEIARAGEDAVENGVMLRCDLEDDGRVDKEALVKTIRERVSVKYANLLRIFKWKLVRSEGLDEIYVRMEYARPLEMSYGSVAGNEDIRRLGVALCESLAEQDQMGLVHGEICPGNIWAAENGQFRLGDIRSLFAVNREAAGDRDERFLSPEEAQGKAATHVSDIYSLGLVLYWLLNERRMPFLPLLPAPVKPGMEEDSARRRLAGETLPPPRHGSRELKAVVCRACEANPRKRYRTARELLEALRDIPVEDGEDQTEVKAEKPAEKRRKPDRPVRQKTPAGERRNMLLPLLAGLAAILAGGWFLFHPWASPTCTEPETCRICGKTQGEALGHQWGEAACEEKPLCTVCGAERQEVQQHEWILETCEAGAVCLRCFEQQPAPGHSWVEATCLEPRHCEACYLTEGEIVDHRWEPATRDHPERCVDCGLTEGVALMPGVRFASSTCGSYDLLGEDYVGDDGYTLRVGNCVEFAGAAVTVTDSAGANVDMSRFSVEWVGNQVTIRVLEGLEPGVYKIRYGSTGIWTWLDYGYSREIYHCQNDLDDGYFLVNQNWKNGNYLTTDGRTLKTSPDWDDVMPISIKKLMGGDGRKDYESRIYWYCGEKAERTLLRTYVLGGKYLASDADGVVYLSDTLTEECYWIYQYLLS